ncbi:unnamed protein product, partial [Mesorhabditis belari]|uniref:Tryptophan synthase beta chain-like PALP domain-containing protein n=1 Tax=Mesorhabditis belari TaxID=2138241 RepID=A0AAF3EBT5_9BILA
MVNAAEKAGRIFPGRTTLIEPTSGNTGIALAFISVKGYRLIFTMPASMSVERRVLLRAYGSEVVLTAPTLGMQGSIELQGKIFNSYIPQQFENPANPLIHYLTTGPEIWEQTNGKVDVCLRSWAIFERKEPQYQNLRSGAKRGCGPLRIYDGIITVHSDEAALMSRQMAQAEGLLCGISSGASVCASLRLLNPRNAGKIDCDYVTFFWRTSQVFQSLLQFARANEDDGG